MPDPDFVTEVESGDRRRGLLALRTLLARTLEGAAPRDVASLSRRLIQVLEELEQLGDDADERTADDELATRRAALMSAAGVGRTAEGG